jgi:uncharacterized protein (DUF2267 family)
MPDQTEDKLEEIDLLKLLSLTREIELYEAQITILRMKQQEANRVNAALHKLLRDKYHVTDGDQIDGTTGAIVRAPAGPAPDGQ